jgi:uncharacterized protein VirK/YbjX
MGFVYFFSFGNFFYKAAWVQKALVRCRFDDWCLVMPLIIQKMVGFITHNPVLMQIFKERYTD